MKVADARNEHVSLSKYTQVRHLGRVFWELKNFHIVLRSIYFALEHIYDCHRFEEWDRRPMFQVVSALSRERTSVSLLIFEALPPSDEVFPFFYVLCFFFKS